VHTQSFSPEEKDAINLAVTGVYSYIDSTIMDLRGSEISVYGVQKMIGGFAGNHYREPGFMFTLNQDLFMERHYYNGERPTLPEIIPKQQRWFTSFFNDRLRPEDFYQLPDTVARFDITSSRSKLYYVKLHGSMNWFGRVENGSGQKMIIGRGKEDRISKEPLLAHYLKIFEDVLCSGKHKLLIIGYGFADSHINKILLRAKDNGLRIYILQPGSPKATKEHMNKQGCGDLWAALGDYFPYDLKTLFPSDQAVTAQWKHLRSRFFDDRHGLSM
jgi:hypothetical protein